MKKTFSIAGALALCITMIPTVTSCGDDDGNEPGMGGSTIIEENTGTRLTSVGNVLIKYDSEGRVSRFGNDDEYGEIDYKDGVIYMSDFSDEGGDIKVKFNGSGYIASLSQDWEYTYDGEWSKGSGKVSFSYDGDGHLEKVSMSSSEKYKDEEYGESGEYSEETTVELKWRNGNLVQILQNGTESEKSDDGGYDKDDWIEDYAFDYSMMDNLFLQMTLSQFDNVLDESGFSVLACAGFFGVGSKTLPSRIVETDEDGYTRTSNLSFTLNPNGTIASETENGYTYNYGYGDVVVVRSASDDKIFSSKKGRLFRTHRDRR